MKEEIKEMEALNKEVFRCLGKRVRSIMDDADGKLDGADVSELNEIYDTLKDIVWLHSDHEMPARKL